MRGMAFDAGLLRRLETIEEVEVETRRASGTSPRTTIWIVVDGGQVYVRSVRGPGGRWYQRLRRDPAGAPTSRARGRPCGPCP